MSETIPPSWPPAGDMPEREPDQPMPPAPTDPTAAGDRVARRRAAVASGSCASPCSSAPSATSPASGSGSSPSSWRWPSCIFLHELGHYLAAKRAGMKVTEFFLGFGPRIWSFQRGETEYGIKLIPAGAYVRSSG